MNYFQIAVIAMSAIAFVMYGIDKLLAVSSARRISEKLLLSVTLLGGGVGALCGMVLFHHKVSKPKFRYTVPIVFIAQMLALHLLAIV